MKSSIPGLDIVPATVDLSGAEVELVSVEERTSRLRKAFDNHRGHDVCFIDCPPSLGLLTLNALSAADTLLVPLQCEFFALEGLSQLLLTVERVQQAFNPDLGIVGIVLTMFDRRNRLTDQVADDVRDCLGNLVFESVIPRNVRLSEAPSHGLPALIYDHSCAGSRAYMSLARELIARLPEERKAA
jgi:chromosome partitioning protein